MQALYSIGHSRHSSEEFLGLLQKHGIRVLVDVRSFPGSRQAPQFNREELKAALQSAGIEYVYAGATMGGRARDPYEKIRRGDSFRQSVRELIQTSQEKPTVMMCAEEDPFTCHRRFLITRSLLEDFSFLNVQHIRKDGSLLAEPGFPESAVQLTLGL